jgi:hypothetical protein
MCGSSNWLSGEAFADGTRWYQMVSYGKFIQLAAVCSQNQITNQFDVI